VYPNQILKIHGDRLELSKNEKYSINVLENGVEMQQSKRNLKWL
jgi:hypothetical protein